MQNKQQAKLAQGWQSMKRSPVEWWAETVCTPAAVDAKLTLAPGAPPPV